MARLALIYPVAVNEARIRDAGEVDEASALLVDGAQEAYSARAAEFGDELLRKLERTVVLSIIDNKWREHLAEMDYLRAGIGLRAMGQKDPLVEYQREGYDMFSDMVASTKADSVRYLFNAQVVEQPARPDPVIRLQGTGGAAVKRQAKAEKKVGRNSQCPCGSGKKYKRCHGAVA